MPGAAAAPRFIRTARSGPGATTTRASSALLGAPAGAEVQLLRQQGQVLRRFAAGTASLERQGLPAGVYLVRAGQQVARLVVQ